MRCIALLITLLSLSLPCGSRKQRITVFITTYTYAQDIPCSSSLCRCYAWGYLELLHAYTLSANVYINFSYTKYVFFLINGYDEYNECQLLLLIQSFLPDIQPQDRLSCIILLIHTFVQHILLSSMINMDTYSKNSSSYFLKYLIFLFFFGLFYTVESNFMLKDIISLDIYL